MHEYVFHTYLTCSYTVHAIDAIKVLRMTLGTMPLKKPVTPLS